MIQHRAFQEWWDRQLRVYSARTPGSLALAERARQVMPGGDTRSSVYMRPYSLYASGGQGSELIDIDGNRYIDLICNATVLIHGHAHPAITDAVARYARSGTSQLAANRPQVELAEELVRRVPSMDMVRFTNSGTEAVMQMVKLARAFTNRDVVVKESRAYHGTWDALEFGGIEPQPSNHGVPQGLSDNVAAFPKHDLVALERVLNERKGEVAAVIVTPILSIDSWEAPAQGFLEEVRLLALANDALLLFDEVISFRASRGGAQAMYGVTPDMTALGKLIGGGLPVGAVGGRQDIMQQSDPGRESGYVQHAGTFNGNPVVAAAGKATLELLDETTFRSLDESGIRLAEGLNRLLSGLGLSARVEQIGSLVSATIEGKIGERLEQLRPELRVALTNHGLATTGRLMFALSSVHSDTDVDVALERMAEPLSEVVAIARSVST